MGRHMIINPKTQRMVTRQAHRAENCRRRRRNRQSRSRTVKAVEPSRVAKVKLFKSNGMVLLLLQAKGLWRSASRNGFQTKWRSRVEEDNCNDAYGGRCAKWVTCCVALCQRSRESAKSAHRQPAQRERVPGGRVARGRARSAGRGRRQGGRAGRGRARGRAARAKGGA